MVSVMKLEKAPQETYADIGGLDTQIQEIKVVYYDLFMYFCILCYLYLLRKPFEVTKSLKLATEIRGKSGVTFLCFNF